MPSVMRERSEPDTRTILTPPRPGGVAIAAMRSVAGTARQKARPAHAWSAALCGGYGRFARGKGVHVPLLEDLEAVVDQAIRHQTRRKENEHDREGDRHDLHHLGLHRILDGGW